jgi:antitoxin (DNA-binding transcriptional repressor) of toxin-antitoxin stability system
MSLAQSVTTAEFQTHCLHFLNQVHEMHQEVIITQNDKPISRLVPYQAKTHSLFGLHKGLINSAEDILSPVEEWDADK